MRRRSENLGNFDGEMKIRGEYFFLESYYSTLIAASKKLKNINIDKFRIDPSSSFD